MSTGIYRQYPSQQPQRPSLAPQLTPASGFYPFGGPLIARISAAPVWPVQQPQPGVAAILAPAPTLVPVGKSTTWRRDPYPVQRPDTEVAFFNTPPSGFYPFQGSTPQEIIRAQDERATLVTAGIAALLPAPQTYVPQSAVQAPQRQPYPIQITPGEIAPFLSPSAPDSPISSPTYWAAAYRRDFTAIDLPAPWLAPFSVQADSVPAAEMLTWSREPARSPGILAPWLAPLVAPAAVFVPAAAAISWSREISRTQQLERRVISTLVDYVPPAKLQGWQARAEVRPRLAWSLSAVFIPPPVITGPGVVGLHLLTPASERSLSITYGDARLMVSAADGRVIGNG